MSGAPIPAPGAHGGDAAAVAAWLGVARSAVLDLSQTLNPWAADPRPVIARHLDAVRDYPDDGPATDVLAAALGMPADRVLLTNGAAEAIAIVAAELGPGWAEPDEFSLYRRHLHLHDRPGRRGLDEAGPRWRANPHNPRGTLAGPGSGADVWDEAFWPMSTGTWTRGDADRGAIVIGSLTKLLAVAGLRIGYILCSTAAMRARLEHRRPRWSVNGLVCAALPELLDTVDLVHTARAVAAGRVDLAEVLSAHGLAVVPSVAPWLLVTGDADLRTRLARQAVVVRDCTSFAMPGTFRIAVPDAHGLGRLDEALRVTSAPVDGVPS